MDKEIFKTIAEKYNKASVKNNAGGEAYLRENEEALAQLAVTGTFGNGFYVSADNQLEAVLDLTHKVSATYLAQVIVYARKSAHMKDMTAVLLAVLLQRDAALFKRIFHTVVDSGKVLRNFCQVIRSGAIGRKSFGSLAKNEIRQWLQNRSVVALFSDSVGNDPSLADVIRMVHPHPGDATREALYGYLIGSKKTNLDNLPDIVKDYEAFKAAPKGEREIPPRVNFLLLAGLDLSTPEWKALARNMSWTALRMNLNTLQRHGCFEDETFVSYVAKRISSEEEIARAKLYPYQVYTAWRACEGLPSEIQKALEIAANLSIRNVQYLGKKMAVAVDFSGSMNTPVTGVRAVATACTCAEVGALIASTYIATNDVVDMYRFDTNAQRLELSRENSILENAKKIAANGGGTDVSASMRELNKIQSRAEIVLIVSDNESWALRGRAGQTALHNAWREYLARVPAAKLVLIDLAPGYTTQAASSKSVLNVGGWSDACFEAIHQFVNGETANWVSLIRNVSLDPTS